MSDPIRTEFLVYGECVCGWRMAAPAGAIWPKCPRCERRIMPPLGRGSEPRYGYVAELHPEQEAYLDERCEITDADDHRRDQPSEGGPLVIKLGSGKTGYCMYSVAELERAEVERQQDQARLALSNWHYGSLFPRSWTFLPWTKRFRLRTARALVAQWWNDRLFADGQSHSMRSWRFRVLAVVRPRDIREKSE